MATYGTIGAAAVLAGYSRLSFSLAVIMLETTENVNLFLPIIFALFISFGVGRIFNRSLYSVSLNFKSVPFLVEKVPKQNMNILAEDIMSSNVVSVPTKVKIEHLIEVLEYKRGNLNGFPVVREDKKCGGQYLEGIITRHTLLVLIKNLK